MESPIIFPGLVGVKGLAFFDFVLDQPPEQTLLVARNTCNTEHRNNLKGYVLLRKYLIMFESVKVYIFAIGLLIPSAWASSSPTISELHPPVVVSIGQKKISVFFLKNELKVKNADVHVPGAEIFYSPLVSSQTSFKYVWKIEGEEIVSVFFYDWMAPEKKGKSMYVLSRSRLSNASFEGVTYSAMEFPIIDSAEDLTVSFFSKDLPDPVLESCNEGRDLIRDKFIKCAYKSAAAIKKYLETKDK